MKQEIKNILTLSALELEANMQLVFDEIQKAPEDLENDDALVLFATQIAETIKLIK